MSLKAFHVVFVAIALMLCLGLGVWAAGQYRSIGDKESLYISAVSFVAGVILGVYGMWFLRKLRNVSYI